MTNSDHIDLRREVTAGLEFLQKTANKNFAGAPCETRQYNHPDDPSDPFPPDFDREISFYAPILKNQKSEFGAPLISIGMLCKGKQAVGITLTWIGEGLDPEDRTSAAFNVNGNIHYFSSKYPKWAYVMEPKQYSGMETIAISAIDGVVNRPENVNGVPIEFTLKLAPGVIENIRLAAQSHNIDLSILKFIPKSDQGSQNIPSA